MPGGQTPVEKKETKTETKTETTKTDTTKDPETGADTRGMNTDPQAADGAAPADGAKKVGDAGTDFIANMK